MAQGLRPHRHVCFVSDIQPYYDKKKHQKMKKTTFECYIPNCNYCYSYSVSEEYRPPPKKANMK